MLRPYHTDTLPTRDREEGAALLWLALGGALAVVAAVLFSPLMAFASGAAWRWIAGSLCIGLCFGAAALALWQAGRAARHWRAVAVSAHNQLLVPQLAALHDAPPFTVANAITSPLAVVAPSNVVPAATDLDATSALPTVSTTEERQSTMTGVLHRPIKHGQAEPAAQTTAPGPVVYDPLTGAVTHATLMTRLETDVAAALAHERPLALAVFDIDHFRTINTLYGYRFGDEVLFAVAEQVRRQLQEDALLARLGADRFAVVWSGTHFPQAHMLAEGILAATNGKPLMITQGTSSATPHERVQVSLRAGLALCPDDGRSAAALLDIAEHALQAQTMANILRAPDALPMLDDLDATGIPLWPLASEHSDAEPWPLSYLDVMMEKNGSIQALASALEARDLDGIAHARNLAELAQETALLLNRSPEEARLVGLAALLHDVGNLGIPAEIFAKTEPLSQEEWAFVREHPHLGERLLTSVGGVLAAVAPIIAAQRERWDGTGYPLGTGGEAIPLGARIVAICDVYGALVSERPYRSAFTHAEALGELERCAGTQFDPAVVQAFIAAASA